MARGGGEGEVARGGGEGVSCEGERRGSGEEMIGRSQGRSREAHERGRSHLLEICGAAFARLENVARMPNTVLIRELKQVLQRVHRSARWRWLSDERLETHLEGIDGFGPIRSDLLDPLLRGVDEARTLLLAQDPRLVVDTAFDRLRGGRGTVEGEWGQGIVGRSCDGQRERVWKIWGDRATVDGAPKGVEMRSRGEIMGRSC